MGRCAEAYVYISLFLLDKPVCGIMTAYIEVANRFGQL